MNYLSETDQTYLHTYFILPKTQNAKTIIQLSTISVTFSRQVKYGVPIAVRAL